jgi:hypothetical protein
MEGLSGYPYSEHSTLLGKVERPWQAVDEVLAWFGGDRRQARRRYEAFVTAGAAQGAPA